MQPYVVELGLADRHVTDCELCVCLRNQTSAASGQKAGSFMDTFATGEGEDGAEGGNRSLISSKPEDLATSSFLLMT